MKKIILGLLLIGGFCLSSNKALAQCTCASPYYDDLPAYEQYRDSDVVFVGKITDIKEITRKNSDNYELLVKVKVSKAWKRDINEVITIRNTVSGCLNGFGKDEEWLIYAYARKDGIFGTRPCATRTKPLLKATEDLKEFEEKGEKNTKVLQLLKSS